MAADPVVVDTSIWIDYFRGRDTPALQEHLGDLLDVRAARVPRVVMAELCQGAHSERELKALDALFRADLLIDQTERTWQSAGRIGFELRRRGITVSLTDCYIGAIALERRWAVWTLDAHFGDIARVRPLLLHRP